MKKILLPLSFLFLAACVETPDGTVVKTTDAAGTPSEHSMPVTEAGQIIDPVCGMVKTDSWTDYSIYKGDTVWFCAGVEKKAFDANPEKYAAKIQK